MIVAVPVALGVNVTEHVPSASVHDAALKLPAAPVEVKLTEPVGVLLVPAAVSATVAVHVLACPTTTGDVHETVVLVVRRFTVTDTDPLLPACVVSPP